MIKQIIKRVITAILILIVFVLGYFVVANVVATTNNSIASFFGYSISYVPTESMEPYISSGSTIMFEQKTSYSELETGDVIVYYNDETNMYVIHRIKSKTEYGFVMQGDNNSVPDYYQGTTDYYYVTEDNYVGKYVCTVSAFSLSSSFARNVVFILAIFVFLFIVVSEVFTITKALDSKKKKNNFNEIDKETLKEEVLKELKEELNKKNNND